MEGRQSTALLQALAAFSLFSFGDAVVKSMAGLWPGPAVALLRYALAAIALSGLLLVREGRAGFAFPRPGMQLLRGSAIGLSIMTFFSALFVMPLATATAIGFTSPMMTALFAILFLGEPARRTTWLASLMAFAGVLIVLRPNFGVLGVFVILPVIGALGMSVLIVANRAVAGLASNLSMQVASAGVATLLLAVIVVAGHLSGIAVLHVSPPPASVVLRCALVACSASLGHWLLFNATMRVGAATIAPMSYVQLLIAVGLGWAIYGERPDAVALLGAGVIVLAGLWLWHDGRMREPVAIE